MPALPLTQPTGSSNRFFFSGALGVTGAAQNVDFDLTGDVTPGSAGMPAATRADPTFRDNWNVLVRQTDPGITDVLEAVDFLPAAPAVPTTLRLVVDSDAALGVLNGASIEFIFEHSIVR
jgi:hypothetical protein